LDFRLRRRSFGFADSQTDAATDDEASEENRDQAQHEF
jgi:hypothetical protein